MHVTCISCACNVHTVCMECPITCMGCACNMHRVSMECACYKHGITNKPCMLHAWLPRHRQLVKWHAWTVHVTCMSDARKTSQFFADSRWVPCMFKELCMVHACSYPLPGIWQDTSRYIPCMEFHTCNCLLRTGNIHVTGAPFWVGMVQYSLLRQSGY